MQGNTTEPDRVLLRRALGGDRAAFDRIFEAWADRLRAFIRSRLRPPHGARLDVEEILQDTFVRAHGSMQGFRGESAAELRRWLTGVAAKTVLRAEEKARRHRTLEIRDIPDSDEVSPSRALRREERFERLQRALDALSGDHREVILLTRIDGLSLKQAAGRMGRSPEAVRKLFWRALKELRSALTGTESLHLPDRRLDREEEP